jgi:hypothetical protein
MKIQIQIINKFGNFNGELLNVDEFQYETIIEMSKNFYMTGFEMETEDGEFVIIPPDIVRDSILKIVKK